MVAQVNEQHAAMVSHAVHPAGKADGFANIGGGEVVAFVAAEGVHGFVLKTGSGAPDGTLYLGLIHMFRAKMSRDLGGFAVCARPAHLRLVATDKRNTASWLGWHLANQ
jgi:hypothetical protein